LELAIGDVTLEATDAIVNPVGGQVDQAVRKAAGPALDAALRERIAELDPPRLVPGQIVVTDGFALRTKHVLHCAPPVYAADPVRARTELETCHIEALGVAKQLAFISLSIPAIATGVQHFPLAEAAAIATRVVIEGIRGQASLRLVRFVLNGPATLDTYADAARRQLALR
jgi:O-acetyl-ADP-ribose deacetylase (regulator of RNase III)